MCKSLSQDIVIREVKLQKKPEENPTTEFQKMLNSTPKTSAKPPVHALLLAGGRSNEWVEIRLTFVRGDQLERTLELLAQLNIPASLSIRDGRSTQKCNNAGVSPIMTIPSYKISAPWGHDISLN